MARSRAARQRRHAKEQSQKKKNPPLKLKTEQTPNEVVNAKQESAPPPSLWSTSEKAFPFFTLPAELRNTIYDYLVSLHSPDLLPTIEPQGPLPIPISRPLLALRTLSRQFSHELLSRLFHHGATLRLNLIPLTPTPYPCLNLCMETSQTRMNLRGTCPLGTQMLLADLTGSYTPPYKKFEMGVPEKCIHAFRKLQIKILFRACMGSWRCGACKRYCFERDGSGTLFDVAPTLELLSQAWLVVLRDVGRGRAGDGGGGDEEPAVVEVEITQEGNWLGFEKKRFLGKGSVREVVIVSGGVGKDGYEHGSEVKKDDEDRSEAEIEAEMWWRHWFPEVRMRVRIITTSNPEDDDGWHTL